MRGLVAGMCVLLTVSAARAEAPPLSYAKEGPWEIVAESDRKLCKMFRVYGSRTDSHLEGLFVRYDAQNENVLLTWSTDAAVGFPAYGETYFLLEFIMGKSVKHSWDNRLFKYVKPATSYYFSHMFRGPKNSRRVLHDLATSDVVGFSLGPAVMSGLPLDASAAVRKLRQCSVDAAKPSSPRPTDVDLDFDFDRSPAHVGDR